MSDAIFISYRRDDAEGEAGRLYDDLIRVFGPDAVFMDVSDIHPGKDFRQAIDDNVAQCNVLLAVIGPHWTAIQDASGARRIDQPNDFVRLEIASALAKGIDVIPVLVHEARMPNPSELPETLQNLSYRNGVEVTHARWNSDVELLIRTLREYVKQGRDIPTLQIRSVIQPVQSVSPAVKAPVEPPPPPPPVPPAAMAPPPPRSAPVSNGIVILILVLALIAGAGGYILLHQLLKHPKRKTQAPTSEVMWLSGVRFMMPSPHPLPPLSSAPRESC